MHKYPSDITREQFEIIRPILEEGRIKTRPRTYDLYDVFCGLLYILSSGCQWRMLPVNYPKWQNVYYHYRLWKKKDKNGDTALDRALKKLSS